MTTRNTVPQSNGATLTAIVGSLLNTKLNYLQQQESFVLQAYEDIQRIDPSHLDPASQKSKLRMLKERLDDFINRLEQLAHARKMLKVIRTFLNESTALTIYELISSDQYLDYTEQKLRSLLRMNGMFRYAGQLSNN